MSFQPRIVRRNKNTSRPLIPIPTSSNVPPPPRPPISTDSAMTPVPSTSSTTSESSNPLSFLLPRSITKRKPVVSNLPAIALTNLMDTAETTTIAASTSNLLKAVKLDPIESDRLESILSALESIFSDWGLSIHKAMREKMKASQDGYVHLQFILQNSIPVNALTKVQVDIQKALRSRESRLLELSPTGFQVRRKNAPDYDTLANIKPEDWEHMTLYLENLPSVPGILQTTHTLSDHLSALFSTSIQKIVLPPLYDPAHPIPSNLGSKLHPTPTDPVLTQDESYLTGQKKGKSLNLPPGGGPFKGLAFIVVGRKEDAENILKQWKWNKETQESVESGKGKEVENDSDVMMGGSEVENNYGKLARGNGMRALSYAAFLDLKTEYLEYQRALLSLQSHSEQNYKSDHPSSSNHTHSNYNDSHLTSNRKRDRPESNYPESNHKKYRRASSPSGGANSNNNKNKRARDTSPDYDLGGTEGKGNEDILGAFPKGCVLWIRNVYEKTTRGGLKALIAGILDNLEEGSGTGIQYVDYDKGMDTCHARFSSPHLASIITNHFAAAPLYHLTPSLLSLTPPPTNPDRKAILTQLLEGDRERIYWEALPEATRREARKFGGVPVAVAQIKTKKARKEEGAILLELEKQDLEIEKVLETKVAEKKLIPTLPLLEDLAEVVVKPRKKPSKF